MSTTKASAALMDAQAAAEVEGFFEATPEQRANLRRLRTLEARQTAVDNEIKAIKAGLVKDLEEVGGVAITVNGRNAVLIVGKTKEEFYREQHDLAYPEIAAAYYEAQVAYDEHVGEFTYRVQATPAKTFPGIK